MNRDLLRRVADVIELEDRFDLRWYAVELNEDGQAGRGVSAGELVQSCKTVGCVAGWTAALSGNPAGYALDLTQEQCGRLFYGCGDSVWSRLADSFGWELDDNHGLWDWQQITAVQAAKVLRQIADGEVEL